MEHRPELRVAAILAAVIAIAAGCSRDMPTSAKIEPPRPGTAPPVNAVTFIRPVAISTVRKLPELGVFEGGGVGGVDAQSTYFRTTDANREFRRGFAEFVIPEFKDVFSARIVMQETRGGTAYPLPPDRHELSFYTDVDRLVDTGDYDRSTRALATVETDSNLEQRKFELDASRLVTRLRGAGLGLRVKLEADPSYLGMGFLGSAFAIRIEVTTTSIEANELLQGVVRTMELEPRLADVLLARLQRVGAILGDSDPNDVAACRELTAFIDEVVSHERDGLLTAPQFTDLEELAGNIRTAIGCR